MTLVLIYTVYASLAMLAFRRLSKLNVSSLNFSDGILVSAVFYLVVPLGMILWEGQFKSSSLHISGYYPFEDVYTTYNIFLGIVIVLLFHFLTRREEVKNEERGRVFSKRYKIELCIFLSMLLILEIYTVYASGRLAGGHWQGALKEAYRGSASLIVLSNFLNAFRAMVFGLIFFVWRRRGVSTYLAIFLGAAVVVVDLVLTLNRITIAYFYIFFLLINSRNAKYLIPATILIIPAVAPLSSAWTMIRSLAIYDGYSIAGFSRAIDDAFFAQHGIVETSVALSTSSIFESSNIQVLHNVIERFPDEYDLFYGWTYFLRPLVIFIPSTIWPDKPQTFGVFLGGNFEYIEGLALNSTFIGEPYGNFYYFWPLAYIIMMSLYFYIFKEIQKRAPYVGSMAFFCGFALGRFEITFASICVLSLIAFILFAHRLKISPRKMVRLN